MKHREKKGWKENAQSISGQPDIHLIEDLKEEGNVWKIMAGFF